MASFRFLLAVLGSKRLVTLRCSDHSGARKAQSCAALPLLLLVALVAFTGCFYGRDTETSVIRLTSTTYPPTSSAKLYFRAPTDADGCTPLALLEVAGSKYEDKEHGLALMVAKATELGADAIFSVTTARTARAEGDELRELLEPSTSPDVYSSHVASGLAARCNEPSKEPPPLAHGPPTGKPDYGRLFEPRPAPAPARR